MRLLLTLIVIAQFTTTEAGLGVCPSVDCLGKGNSGSKKRQDLGSTQFENVQLLGKQELKEKRQM